MNGKKKLASPTAPASFHLSLKTSGSSSAPARNVRMIAPIPERNLIQDSSVPRIAEPIAAPIMSWAMVPTTISERAVEIRNQIESRLAISARPSHNAASAHTPVMTEPAGRELLQATSPERAQAPFSRQRSRYLAIDIGDRQLQPRRLRYSQ